MLPLTITKKWAGKDDWTEGNKNRLEVLCKIMIAQVEVADHVKRDSRLHYFLWVPHGYDWVR